MYQVFQFNKFIFSQLSLFSMLLTSFELRHHRGESFVTSDAQLVNYTNIQSEGADSR